MHFITTGSEIVIEEKSSNMMLFQMSSLNYSDLILYQREENMFDDEFSR